MRYVLDFGPNAEGTPAFTVFRSLLTGLDVAAPALAALEPEGYVDFDYDGIEPIHFRAELGARRFIAGTIDPRMEFPLGDGSVAVDHDYGGTDALRILSLDHGGAPVDNAWIYAYLASDWAAGNRSKRQYCRGWTVSDVEGRWPDPIFLDPADYTLVIVKEGFRTFTIDLTVT